MSTRPTKVSHRIPHVKSVMIQLTKVPVFVPIPLIRQQILEVSSHDCRPSHAQLTSDVVPGYIPPLVVDNLQIDVREGLAHTPGYIFLGMGEACTDTG